MITVEELILAVSQLPTVGYSCAAAKVALDASEPVRTRQKRSWAVLSFKLEVKSG
jgi:hypothetical protein